MENPPAIPGYRILRVISRGGMAAVYLAIQESFGREVALKVMSPSLTADPGFAERFAREARIVAQMHHSAIVPVFDVGEAQGHQYLSMEYLSGGDLKQRLQHEAGPLLACRVCLAMAEALDLAHRKGFVHRDIKPENILFREDGSPVLTDFGIARAIDSAASLTRSGMLVGTPSYMSPEQLRGEEVDGRSDLYSLGIVFYEALTGSVPFRADSSISVAIKHLNENLPPLPPAYAAFQPFLNRLTAKDRAQRFATGADVVRALQALTGDSANRREPTPTEPTLIYEAPLIAQRGGHTGEIPADEPLLPLESPRRRDSLELPNPRRETLSGREGRRRPYRRPRARRPSRWPQLLLVIALLVVLVLWLVPDMRERLVALLEGPAPLELAQQEKEARLSEADAKLQRGDGEGALASYGAVLAEDAGDNRARAGIERVAELYLREAQEALLRGDIDAAEHALRRARAVAPRHGQLPSVASDIAEERSRSVDVAGQQPADDLPAERAQQQEQAAREQAAQERQAREQAEREQRAREQAEQERLAREQAQREEAARQQAAAQAEQQRQAQVREQRLQRSVQENELLENAQSALARGDLVQPQGASAVDYYRDVLRLNPRNTTAHTGLLNVQARLLGDAERDIKESNLDSAVTNLAAARSVMPSHPELARVQRLYREKEAELRQQQQAEQAQLGQAWNQLESVDEALGRQPMGLAIIEVATRHFDEAQRMAPGLPELGRFRQRIEGAYSEAVSAALLAGNRAEALAVIEHARRRNWMTPALRQQEAAIQQQTQRP